MRTRDERKAALYARTRRLLAAYRTGRLPGRTYDAIIRRIRMASQALDGDPLEHRQAA